MEIIKFYYEYEEYGWLSNYHVCDFTLDGCNWSSTEHYYQAQKTMDPGYRETIRLAETPDEAKQLGNSPNCHIRPDWTIHRVVAMRTAIQAKFTQNPELMELLLATGNSELVENSMRDYYWGCGADESGRSMLGLLLMHLRTELRRGR
jgi:hypothetical protein